MWEGGRTSSILCKGIRAGSTAAASSEGEGWCREHEKKRERGQGKVERILPLRASSLSLLTLGKLI